MKTIYILFTILSVMLISCSYPARYEQGTKKFSTEEMSFETKIILETQMHTLPIRKIIADNNENYLFTGSMDKTVRVWDMETGELKSTLYVPQGRANEGKVYALAISPDGRTVVIAGWTGIQWEGKASIYFFDVESGRIIYRINNIPNVVHDLSYSSLGTHIVATLGGGDGILVYSTLDYSLSFKDRHYDGSCYDADFSSSGFLVTACYDGMIRLYNRDFNLLEETRSSHGTKPYVVRFSPEGQQIAVGFSDTAAIDVLSGKDLSYLFSPKTEDITEGSFSSLCWGVDGVLYAGGNYADSRSGKRAIRKWYNRGKGKYQDILVTQGDILDVFPLLDGSVIFSSSRPSFGRLYGESLLLYKHPQVLDYDQVEIFELSPDGSTLRFSYPDTKKPYYFSLNRLKGKKEALSPRLPKNDKGQYVPTLPAIAQSKKIKIDSKIAGSFTINGRYFSLKASEFMRSVAMNPSGNTCVIGTNLSIYSFSEEGKLLWEKKLSAAVQKLNISRNNKILIAALNDGTIRWYHQASGIERFSFFPHRDKKRWIIWSPEGIYASSENGASLAQQLKNKSLDVAPDVLALSPVFYKPEIFVQTIESEKNSPSPVEIEQEEKIGSLSPMIHADSVVSPEEISSYVENVYTPKNELLQEKPDLYVLAIGVSEYQDNKWDLEFAAKDAQDITKVLSSPSSMYGKVFQKTLVNKEASRAEILKALYWIQKNSRPQDVAIIFLSGHGTNDANNYYYFLPHNFSQNLNLTAVSFSKIQQVVSSLEGKTILLLDTCRSGGVFGKRININDSFLLSKTSQEKEVFILASSSGDQLSFEKIEWGNGAFTKAILEGLSGKADPYQIGEITISSLYSYISQRVQQLTDKKQTPTIAIPKNSSNFSIHKP